jgi:hypothetical protein
MKISTFSFLGFVLAICSFNVYAESVILNVPANPVPLELQDNAYMVADPTAVVTPQSGVYYFTIEGQTVVCFQEPRSDFVLQTYRFGTAINGTNELYCTSDLGQFTVEPAE